MAATDFQSLLSSPNVSCYLNLSPGEWMGIKLALLQDIVLSLGPSIPTDYQTLISQPNVAAYLNMPPGIQQAIKLALLQDIVLGIGGTPFQPWTPTTPIAGATLVEWLSGNSIAQATGTQVATWPANVGQNAVQPGSTAQPTLIIGAYPNPVVRFNGTSDSMVLASSILVPSQPFSIAMFFKDNGSGNNNIIDGGGAGGFGNLSGQFYAFAPTPVNLQAHDNNGHMMLAVFNGASSKFAFDSGVITPMSSSPGTNAWAGANNIGSGPLSLYAQVDIGEIAIWVGDVSASWSTILAYLQSRW